MIEFIYGTDKQGDHWFTKELIVRCMDCRYYDPNDEQSDVYPDRYWCDLLRNYLQPDGFCAWGKRREGAEL